MCKTLLSCILFAGLGTACTGSGEVTYAGEAQPRLVEVSPGVQVIADSDRPIFYSNNYYWWNDNGAWYRSRSHRDGWVLVDDVPTTIRTIDRPSLYVHYHGEARANLESRHEEHKQYEENQKAAREERKDLKEERKDAKEERKEAKHERKEMKEEREHDHD